jgi:FtsP/CotA-like multicopper oxidase with cupredoxin domain
VTRIQKAIAVAAAVGGLAWASAASAQLPFTNVNAGPDSQGLPANRAFGLQNLLGPKGVNYQVNYPYPGQCLADPLNAGLFPQLAALPACSGGSFAGGQRTAGGWERVGVRGFDVVSPYIPGPTTLKFVFDVLNPPDYTPDKATFGNADYYEIGLHEARGFQALAGLGAFPNPTLYGGPIVPDGMQWTGLFCNNPGNPLVVPPVPAGCTCPSDVDVTAGSWGATYCTLAAIAPATRPRIPNGSPIYTPIWGVGSALNGPGPLGGVNYIATWPSISIRANKGTPVVVKWVNEFPNNHVLCPHPEAADWPCAIDRTFMGVKASIDPAVALSQLDVAILPDGVNQYGSPQQPDNSWVTHLHGAETPPSTDGFAEKWFGNATTALLYNKNTGTVASPQGPFVNPPFENPLGLHLHRPTGNFDTYTYPMVQEEATIWFHDHTLGKTHHNVIAGPAGFFPVKEPLKHGGVSAGVPVPASCPIGYPGCTTEFTWLDPVTELRGGLLGAIPMYDLFFAIQDRAFNDDGSINFSNGLGQTIPPPPAILPIGYTPVTSGVNPQVHPVWVPEYFGDVALVNGVAWPKMKTEPGWYRIRLVDGSDSRCWTIGFQRAAAAPAPGANVSYNVPFYVIANDQGYLRVPVQAPGNRVTMCPGERYELLVNFGQLPGVAAGAPANVYMVNNAPAPFPAGISPQKGFAPDLNVIMAFNVSALNGPGVKSCGQGGAAAPVAPASLTWDPNNMAANMAKGVGGVGQIPATNYANICMPLNPGLVPPDPLYPVRPAFPPAAGSIVRQVYLNEKVDGITLAPLGMQLNGVPFEYKVTETPKNGTTEYWQFVNLTVDAHPMHPHLVSHKILARQTFNVGKYKAALCGSSTCQPGPAPGNEMQVVPDVGPFLTGTPVPVTDLSVEGGPKDAVQAPPGQVTTIAANWGGRWAGANNAPTTTGTAPGTAGCPFNGLAYTCAGSASTAWTYESVTSGPYVWHCHINSHEDSEMMRTSLVVP